jgi:hypothetical protein
VCLLRGAKTDISIKTVKEWIWVTTCVDVRAGEAMPKRSQGRLGCLSGKSKTHGDVSSPLVIHPISRHADSQIKCSQKAKKTTCKQEATLDQKITEGWRSVLFYRQRDPLAPFESTYSEGI